MNPDQERRLATWMREAQEGDREAYALLLNEIRPLLLNFTRAHAARADWADDAVQETLLSLHKARHTYDPARPFSPWLYAIARHRLIDFARKQRRRLEHEAPTDVEPADRFDDLRTTAEPLRWALDSLPSRQRTVIQMLKSEGHSVKDVARMTGMSESSVKVTAHRGYKKLRALLLGDAHAD